MDFKYTEGLLLSDLLCLYRQTNDKKYFEEIKQRLFFCGFSINEIHELINFETEIMKIKTEQYSKPILKKYWIIGKKTSEHIFERVEDYIYDPNNANPNILLLSETLSIIDEAFFLTYSKKLENYKAINEIINIADETPENWLFYEFKNRIEYICRCANHIVDGPKSTLYNEKANNLFDNEMQICLIRWKNVVDVSVRDFIPYTEQYFIGKE